MAALIQFVDSIAADPVVRLDLNDAQSWFCTNFKAPPPRLRRSESENSMRDGGVVGSSSYGNRTLELDLTLIEDGEEEWAAEEMQKLWRELDRATNVLRYWPEGLDKPVFFRTFRSDVSELEELWTTPIARNISLELLAEPFALGLMETLGPYTVNNNPAAASNPCYVDLPTILGDVATPLTYWDSPSGGATYKSRLVAMQSGVVSPSASFQAEAAAAATDTSNPGGGPDAAMSGTGTNNYMVTTFAGAPAMSQRLAMLVQAAGRYRALALVRRTANTGTIQVRAVLQAAGGAVYATGSTVSIATSTARQVVDLGVFEWPPTLHVGRGSASAATVLQIGLEAARVSGTDSLHWDAVLLVPAGDQEECIVTQARVQLSRWQYLTLDGPTGAAYAKLSSADPTAGGVAHEAAPMSGGTPFATPNASNRLHVLSFADGAGTTAACAVTTTTQVSLAYNPQYLFVRPVSS